MSLPMPERITRDPATLADDFMASIIIRCVTSAGTFERQAWVVPGTEGTFAIDQRAPERLNPSPWAITHIPSGYRAGGGILIAGSKARAAQLAKNFFREGWQIGCNFHLTDGNAACAPICTLKPDQYKSFWERVSCR